MLYTACFIAVNGDELSVRKNMFLPIVQFTTLGTSSTSSIVTRIQEVRVAYVYSPFIHNTDRSRGRCRARLIG